MSTDESTTVENNPSSDADASTTTTDSTTTDHETANTSDNLNQEASTDSNVEQSTTTESTSTPVLDQDIDAWAEKRFGSKPTTDEQRIAYQEARNEQREYTKAQQAKRESETAKALSDEVNNTRPELDNEDDDIDPLEKKVNDLQSKLDAQETTRLQSEFYLTNKVTEAESKVIVDVFKEKIAEATTVEDKRIAHQYWSNPSRLSGLLEIAKARIASGSDAVSLAAEESARQERERIAKESQANSPGRGAKMPVTGAKTPEQERLERFTNWD